MLVLVLVLLILVLVVSWMLIFMLGSGVIDVDTAISITDSSVAVADFYTSISTAVSATKVSAASVAGYCAANNTSTSS